MTPRTWFIVTRPAETPPFMAYPTREHAEAVVAVKRLECAAIGPWSVVELREVAEVRPTEEAA